MTLTSKFSKDLSTLRAAANQEIYLDVKNPKLYKNAKLIKNITYSEVITKNLKVMDMTAISLAKESNIPIFITSIFEENSLIRALKEEGNYSKIH